MDASRGKRIGSPMSETEEIYLFEEDEDLVEKWATYDEDKGGKWILFIRKESMDSMWAKSCKMYREGKFTGIKSIKTSTAKHNPRQSAIDSGVIMFHCGPSDDEDLMMTYGWNVVTQLGFYCKNGYVPYKSDAQSAVGTRATGITKNCLYRLAVPKTWRDVKSAYEYHSNNSSLKRTSIPWRSASVSEATVTPRTYTSPTLVSTIPWLTESSASIANECHCDRTKSGHWLLMFSNDLLDQAWKKAVSLYRKGKLTGIQSMKVSTAMQNQKPSDNQRNRNMGIMLFFCGPCDDLDYVKSCGQNLANLMDYFDPNGVMSYRFKKLTLCKVQVPSPWRRREIVQDSDSDDD